MGVRGGLLVKLQLVWVHDGGFRSWFRAQVAFPALWADGSVNPVARPGCRLGCGAGRVGSSPAWCCAFIHRHVHGLLFDDRGASVRGL